VETISHIRENGRITILFTAFEGPPRILRLFGTGVYKLFFCLASITFQHSDVGTVYEFGTQEYESLISPENRKPGSRAAFVIDVYQCQTVTCSSSTPVSFDLTVPLSPVDILFQSTISSHIAPNSSEWPIYSSHTTALQP
jgi:hypothetical protein